MAIIQYTGHPLVDVGAATITAFVNKERPEDVTEDDLKAVVAYIKEHYVKNPMRSFLTQIFLNSGYVQPSWARPDLQWNREAYMTKVLDGYLEERASLEQPCVFCSQSASVTAFRQHIPLLGSENTFNFYPEGGLGLPVCGACLLCIQAFPLGSLSCEGKVLVVHSDDDRLTLRFARTFWIGGEGLFEGNRTTLQVSSLDNMPNHGFPRTSLVKTLVRVEDKHKRLVELQPCSVTAYHLTNGKTPDISIYHLPLATMSFLAKVYQPTYHEAWGQITSAAWELTPTREKRTNRDNKTKGSNDEAKVKKEKKPPRNYLYEDLFDLPRNAGRFLRTYFLRRPLAGAREKTDPRPTYSPARQRELISWPLTELFLTEVMNVTPEQTEAIKRLGDKLAGYMRSMDKHLLEHLLLARNFSEVVGELEKANRKFAFRQRVRLFDFDELIAPFHIVDDRSRTLGWQLVRDLLLIRMVEELDRHKFFKENPEALAEEDNSEEQAGVADEEDDEDEEE